MGKWAKSFVGGFIRKVSSLVVGGKHITFLKLGSRELAQSGFKKGDIVSVACKPLEIVITKVKP